jgi:transmembrane sensor
MSTPRVTAAMIAEAAAWLAILHGPNRTTAVEQGFSKWLRMNPAHAQAFEEATEIWEESGNLPRPARGMRAALEKKAVRPLLALAAGIVVAVIGVLLYFNFAGVATDLGEQRALILEDGSRILLNTSTRVVVHYDEKQRHIELKTGEAHFEVAKRPHWPFVVSAGARQVTALGTAFTVRREPDRLTVTLVEGKVTVTPESRVLGPFGASQPDATSASAITLTPGQRAIFVADRLAALDQPDLQKTLAWQRREVAFDDTPLVDAIAEMNRYSPVPLALEDTRAERVRITGLFRAGDSRSFARAVGAVYKFQVIEKDDRIVLAGAPHGGGF